MKRNLVALTAAMALGFGGLALAPAQADGAPSAAVVSGEVTVLGKAVAKQEVVFESLKASGMAVYSYTDKKGAYEAKDLKPGRYHPYVNGSQYGKSTFLTTYYGDTVRAPDAKVLTVKDGDAKTVNIAAKPAGKITGYVVKPNGKPVKGVWVTAGARNRYGSAHATTNAKGKYTLWTLPSDTYDIAILSADADFGETAARTVKVKAGQTTIAKTITARRANVGTSTITGKITGALNLYGDSTVVELSNKNYWGFGQVNEKGRVTVSDLPAGTYKVSLLGANRSTKVTVAKGKTARFGTMNRAKGTKILGVVKTSEKKPFKSVTVEIRDSNRTLLASVVTDRKGRYSVPGARPGKYTIAVTSGSAKHVFGDPKTVTVKRGKNLRVNLLTSKAGSITGTVVNADNKPVEGVTVIAASSDTSSGISNIGWAFTDAKGHYKITGLASGKVKVETSDGYEGGYFDAFYKGSTLENSKAVTVKSATVKKIGTIKIR